MRIPRGKDAGLWTCSEFKSQVVAQQTVKTLVHCKLRYLENGDDTANHSNLWVPTRTL